LKDQDWERIEEQHLSPLYVSVHATELELRRKLLVKKDAPDVLEQIRWLGERGIAVHTQLVLLPGLNDGFHLETSLRDLTDLFPTVQSVSLVPIGLTRFHPGKLRTYRPDEATPILDQVEPWRDRCRRELGLTFIYPSDEWYLLAERRVPPAAEYDGFGQIENGVGMVRHFLDEWDRIKYQISNRKYQISNTKYQIPNGKSKTPNPQSPTLRLGSGRVSNLQGSRATLVCGELAAPVLRQVVDELNELTGSQVRVVPIVNNWYGVVTVSGLLTGRDVVEKLKGGVGTGDNTPVPGEMVLLPRVMFDNSGQVTLDDMTPDQIQAALGTPVGVAQHPEELLAALRGELLPQDVLAPKPDWWGEQNHPILFPIEA
jgi:NifB/MoaA-like Fe-S oxidoreductase